MAISPAVSAPKLHTLHFNVTNTCNLGCSFCYIDAIKGKTSTVPIDRVRTLAEEARSVGGVRVIISGGEAFARKDWWEAMSAFANVGFAVSVVTNGTLLTQATVDRLKEINGLTFLVSLDGDADHHDTIRGQRGAHARTIAGIRRLREAGIPTQLNATIIRDNLEDVSYLTKLSRDLEVSVRFSLLNPYNGRGQDIVDQALGVNQVMALRDYCHELGKLGSQVFVNLPPLLLDPEDIIPIRSPSCGWTKSYCGVTYDGNVTICGVAGADTTLYAGNILTESFSDIWLNAPLFNTLRSLTSDDLTGVCSECTYREECGGACRLSAYKGSQDFTASYSMCQAFYDAGVVDERFLEPTATRRSVGSPVA